MLSTSKHEREELVRARSKLGSILSFLKKKGFSEEQVLADLVKDGFAEKSPRRDEFGLPVLGDLKVADGLGPNPFKDKMKGKIGDASDEAAVKTADPVFDEKPVHGSTQDSGKKVDAERPSWSTVVKNGSQAEPLCFDYCPMPAGAERIWVQKSVKPSPQDTNSSKGASPAVEKPVENPEAVKQATAVPPEPPSIVSTPVEEQGNWTTVQHKKVGKPLPGTTGQPVAPTPIFTALAKSLSKGQLKRARKAAGRDSPKK
ncbi:hypothetical protein ACET3Z_028190 [Daucus carota]